MNSSDAGIPATLSLSRGDTFRPSPFVNGAISALERLVHEDLLPPLAAWLCSERDAEYDITFVEGLDASAPTNQNKAVIAISDPGLGDSASYEKALAAVRDGFIQGLQALGAVSPSAWKNELDEFLRSQVRPGDWMQGPQAVSDFGVQRWPAYEEGMGLIAEHLREDPGLLRRWYRPEIHGELVVWFFIVGEGRRGARITRRATGWSYARRLARAEMIGVPNDEMGDLALTHFKQALDALSDRLDLAPPPAIQ